MREMSSKTAHYAAGVVLGAGVVYATVDVFSGWQLLTIFVGCLMGSSAPDTLEIKSWIWGKRISLIPHRTITHWLLGWICVCLWVAVRAVEVGTFGWCVAFGFCLSGLCHVIMDATTPMGVPMLHPYRRSRRHRGCR
ncbi:membrane-bound metal-dependent hydrolase (plasmid) [Burkholderia vietnamiensis G4]|uniref:Membrane-bound metal-dependent hydrolase n=1 Tax=Burkholderia vietnamiensis (strain G4 / LMG 22486) TaxID=269482 RepID=A4JTM4_BURVG|nr:membrane-bound metal-dependent hydrolase [Burkholderia vietnamiensis G4]